MLYARRPQQALLVADIHLIRKKPRVEYPVKKALETVGAADKAAMVLQANTVARSLDRRIRQTMVTYRENRQQVAHCEF